RHTGSIFAKDTAAGKHPPSSRRNCKGSRGRIRAEELDQCRVHCVRLFEMKPMSRALKPSHLSARTSALAGGCKRWKEKRVLLPPKNQDRRLHAPRAKACRIPKQSPIPVDHRGHSSRLRPGQLV